MPTLERLRPDHAAPLLAFERVNREYFAAIVPDRGDAFFTGFADRLAALLAEQDEGICHFHVLVEDGEVLGRVNLVDVADGGADLGYRVAQRVTGRGLATAGVRDVLVLAAQEYRLTEVRAATRVDNPASRAVLARNAFVPVGETVLSGHPGLTFRRDLTR